ncbi:hypothetical protein NL676_002977 [Syzygium grande]|nr:hypothetical protein NL676_002977 [Syzygium grande]
MGHVSPSPPPRRLSVRAAWLSPTISAPGSIRGSRTSPHRRFQALAFSKSRYSSFTAAKSSVFLTPPLSLSLSGFSSFFPFVSKIFRKFEAPFFGVRNGTVMAEEEGCATPRHEEHRIPTPSVCPPPPRKKKKMPAGGKARDAPKNGYFQPPDLDALFSADPRREACA